MRYFCNTTDFYSDGPTAVTLGKFDGLHRGHQKLIEEILRLGSKEEVQTAVFRSLPMNGRICFHRRKKKNGWKDTISII